MSRFEAWEPDGVQGIIDHWTDRPGGWLPMAIGIQRKFGYIDEDAIGPMAVALGITEGEVTRLVNGYQGLKRQPPADHELRICMASPCRTTGGSELVEHIRDALGAGPGDRTADGRIDIEPAFCFGRCALAPVFMVDGNPHGRMTEAKTDGMLEGLGGA